MAVTTVKVKEKIFRDPVHGNIVVSQPLILSLIDTAAFQRLRRIRQLGMCLSTYYGAEHSRFQHSIGCMWLMHRILDHWHRNRLVDLDPVQILTATAAAMLHDVGHGPFSHSLERVFTDVDHEAIGAGLIRRHFGPLLTHHGVDPEEVVRLMNGTAKDRHLSELLSSQLDVDRMDYLLRDSLYTGVKYGLYDIDRIIYTLVPVHDAAAGGWVTAVELKGLYAVEEYIFSRYFMFWQVYLHKTTRASEMLLRMIIQRSKEVASERRDALYLPPNLAVLFEPAHHPDDPKFLERFLALDDFDLFHCIKIWQESADPVLADLSGRFMRRDLFKVFPLPADPGVVAEVRDVVARRFGEDARYYVHVDRPADAAYDYYTAGQSGSVIRVLTEPPDRWREISEVSQTGAIRAIAKTVEQAYLLVASECRDEVRRVLQQQKES